MDFDHVLVVGAGQMGGGIAQVVAASGRRVSLLDPLPGATGRALAAMERSLARLHEKGGGAALPAPLPAAPARALAAMRRTLARLHEKGTGADPAGVLERVAVVEG